MPIDAIRRLWPLSESYEYAAEVGLAIRLSHPGWWREFERAVPAERNPLPQARGFAFLAWCEAHPELSTVDGRAQLAEAIDAALMRSEEHMLVEVEASIECLARPSQSTGDPFPPQALDGQEVALRAPPECWGYPEGATAHLDDWTSQALEGASVERLRSEPATREALLRVHSPHYVDGLLAQAESGGGLITPETLVAPSLPLAALAACGAMMGAAHDALEGRGGVPLALVRPGSHHASRLRGGGTCLINNLAVATVEALRDPGVARVAIIDLDAHHGNGTEEIFYEDERVMTLSIHQEGPFFPGTGRQDAAGMGRGLGANVNLPVGPHDDWGAALESGLVRVARHHPDLILVEFSTDAHRADPVSDLSLSDHDFEQAVGLVESIGAPVAYELGASSEERAWVGGLRALVTASAAHRGT
jgi:acetoin utilization deacetylase AcuC-like enzyme